MNEVSKYVWLDRGILHSLPMDKLYAEIEQMYIVSYGIPAYKQAKYTISCVVGNVVYAYKHNCNLFISRDPKTYTSRIVNGSKQHYGIGYRSVMNVVKMLEDYSIIKSTKGYVSLNKDEDTKKYEVSGHTAGYIELTEIGEDLIMANVDMGKVSNKPRANVLILKDTDKEEMEYEATPETERMLAVVNRYNEFMSEQEVVDEDGDRLHTALARVFSRGDLADPQHLFTYGGRFYSEGTNYQQLPSYDRKRITINGENVYELDFRSIHISIFCTLESVTLPEGYDVYSQYNTSNYVLDDDLVQKVTCWYKQDYNPYREFQKLAWLILINCGKRNKTRGQNRRLAIETLQHKLKEDRELPEHTQRFTGIKTVDIEGVINHIEETFYFAKDLLYSDKGVELMRMDSDIMEQILIDCVEERIPVLCVHDSIIVPQSSVGKAMEIMKSAYGFVCGSTDNCVITVK